MGRKSLYVMNKIDQLTIEELDIIDQMPHHVPISSFHKWNIDMLMEEIWNYLKMMRIYTKPKGQIPDYEEPGSSVNVNASGGGTGALFWPTDP